MRITGLSSGMDIDKLVSDMMTAKRVPLDKLYQQKQTLEWKRDNYRQINSQLVDFRNIKLDNYRKGESMNAFKSEVTGDKAAVTAQATATANQVTMEVTVDNIATQGSITSTASLGALVTKNTTLGSLSAEENFNLTVSRTGSATVNLAFTKGDSIDTVIRKINNSTEANVSASFDEATGKITLKSKSYGEEKITFSGKGFTDALKLNSPDIDSNGNPILDSNGDPVAITTGGTKAKVHINGELFEPSGNKLIVNGVTLEFLAKTEVGKSSTITSKVDSSKILETITSFVKDYNEVMNSLNKKVNEERYRDFTPLTDDQKKDMKEEDIKKWEAKAQSGLLKNDEFLKQVTSDMRGSIVNLSSIGITTGEYYEGGKLYINADKLKKAIEDNPDQVTELFLGASGSTGTSQSSKDKGVFNNIYDKMLGSLDQMATRAGTSKYSADITTKFNEQSLMGKELTYLKTRISATATKMTTLEKRYYAQFSAMETAINKLNSQSSSLAGFAAQ
ncbi:flagellar filament capping protein FliD [Paenibacillus glacialis]|uniref:Flagellar hook-associated protein 2 n=1 Tax=Paenibacillus glacialis TaxID=494026 RepID=A0A168L6D3_9BACL|nr:flagellar filament capping protein FliD [Paenibacillus glacialis]OAB42942.1 hypothetical protein PGLA_10830 [Paenibacillus glacialis]